MKQSATGQIAKAVTTNFVTAGFSTADLLTGPITQTDLPWQCPPLATPETLGGFEFTDYISAPIKVDGQALYKFWRWGLYQLYASPSSVVSIDGGWKGLSQVMPGSSLGEKLLRFSVPEDFPKHNSYSGHVFSLEAANLMSTCVSVQALVSDDKNYYVETPWGPVGVADGMVIGETLWAESIAGYVDVQLSSPRGYLDTTCRYDLLAKVRAVLHDNAATFPEFQGMDYALQTLAKLSQGKLCTELLNAVQRMLPDSFDAKRKIKLVDEALEALDGWTVNDRVKLGSMYEILVPAVFTGTQFASKVYDLHKRVPNLLQVKTIDKIRENLRIKRKQLMLAVSLRDRPALERDL